MTVQNDLRYCRIESEMTQQELAEKVGVSRQTIGSMEKGDYSPSLLLALKIAHALDYSVDEIFYLAAG
jgi:putative transcriptional regulator